jgi:cytochrome c2
MWTIWVKRNTHRLNVMTCKALAQGAVLGLAVTGPVLAASDTEKGMQVFNSQCRACHSLEADKNGVGPTLHGVFGRKAGSLPSYNYSAAMKKSEVTWNDDTVKQFLSDPHMFIPGDKMPFAGIKSQSQLDDLIAYLKEASRGSASFKGGSPAPGNHKSLWGFNKVKRLWLASLRRRGPV